MFFASLFAVEYYSERFLQGEYTSTVIPAMVDAAVRSGLDPSAVDASSAHAFFIRLAPLIACNHRHENLRVSTRLGGFVDVASTEASTAALVRSVHDVGTAVQDTKRTLLATISSLTRELSETRTAIAELSRVVNTLSSKCVDKMSTPSRLSATGDCTSTRHRQAVPLSNEGYEADVILGSGAPNNTVHTLAKDSDDSPVASPFGSLMPAALGQMLSPTASLEGMHAMTLYAEYMSHNANHRTYSNRAEHARAKLAVLLFDHVIKSNERGFLLPPSRVRGNEPPRDSGSNLILLKELNSRAVDYIIGAYTSRGQLVPNKLGKRGLLMASAIETHQRALKAHNFDMIAALTAAANGASDAAGVIAPFVIPCGRVRVIGSPAVISTCETVAAPSTIPLGGASDIAVSGLVVTLEPAPIVTLAAASHTDSATQADTTVISPTAPVSESHGCGSKRPRIDADPTQVPATSAKSKIPRMKASSIIAATAVRAAGTLQKWIKTG